MIKDFEYFNKKYNITILQESNGVLLYKDCYGIRHEVVTEYISKRDVTTPKTVIKEDLIQYHNLITLKDTPLKVLGWHQNKLELINQQSQEFYYSSAPFWKLDIPYIIKKTEKSLHLIERIKEALNDQNGKKYIYPLPGPRSRGKNEKYTLICRKHGPFTALVDNLIRGHGCPKCNVLEGWGNSLEGFCELCNQKYKIGSLYVIRLYNDLETFYKIGITSNRDIYFRSIPYKQAGYQVDLLQLYHGDPKDIYNIENELKQLFINDKYIPNSIFGGHTECFQMIDLDKIQSIINNRIKLIQ